MFGWTAFSLTGGSHLYMLLSGYRPTLLAAGHSTSLCGGEPRTVAAATELRCGIARAERPGPTIALQGSAISWDCGVSRYFISCSASPMICFWPGKLQPLHGTGRSNRLTVVRDRPVLARQPPVLVPRLQRVAAAAVVRVLARPHHLPLPLSRCCQQGLWYCEQMQICLKVDDQQAIITVL